jgi:hypothetical protein
MPVGSFRSSAEQRRKVIMSKKMMLLALAVVSAAAFAVPAGASAQEIHLTNVTSFSGTFGLATLTAEGEPPVTCGTAAQQNHVTGTVNTGGTTGEITLDFTECHIVVLSLTFKCKSTGSLVANTIASSGVFHLITINSKPGILVTPVPTKIECENTPAINVAGNVIGTITSPACGVASNNMTINFKASGPTQEHKTYTEQTYNLTSQTGTGTIKEASEVAESTTSSATQGTLDCT